MVSTHLIYPNGIENLSLCVYLRIVSVRATYTRVLSHMHVSKLKFPCFGSALITVMSVLFQGGKKKSSSCILFITTKYNFSSTASDFVSMNREPREKTTIYLSQLRQSSLGSV